MREPESRLPDADMQADPRALLRAARRAREIARQGNTAIVIVRDGEIVEQTVSAADVGEYESTPEPSVAWSSIERRVDRALPSRNPASAHPLGTAPDPPTSDWPVVVHEMLHLIAPTHGDRFLRLLDRHYPSWREARAELNELPLAAATWTK